jgi:hypothetical protein
VLHVPVPYPSLIELGYGSAPAFWIIGIFFGTVALRMDVLLLTTLRKFIFFTVPFLLVSASFFLFFSVAQKEPLDFTDVSLKLFFDVYYPLTETFILFLVSILMYGLFFALIEKKFTPPVFLLIAGFLLLYFADFAFAYFTSLDAYFLGHWIDLLYITSLFCLSFGLTIFAQRFTAVGNISNHETRL